MQLTTRRRRFFTDELLCYSCRQDMWDLLADVPKLKTPYESYMECSIYVPGSCHLCRRARIDRQSKRSFLTRVGDCFIGHSERNVKVRIRMPIDAYQASFTAVAMSEYVNKYNSEAANLHNFGSMEVCIPQLVAWKTLGPFVFYASLAATRDSIASRCCVRRDLGSVGTFNKTWVLVDRLHRSVIPSPSDCVDPAAACGFGVGRGGVITKLADKYYWGNKGSNKKKWSDVVLSGLAAICNDLGTGYNMYGHFDIEGPTNFWLESGLHANSVIQTVLHASDGAYTRSVDACNRSSSFGDCTDALVYAGRNRDSTPLDSYDIRRIVFSSKLDGVVHKKNRTAVRFDHVVVEIKDPAPILIPLVPFQPPPPDVHSTSSSVTSSSDSSSDSESSDDDSECPPLLHCDDEELISEPPGFDDDSNDAGSSDDDCVVYEARNFRAKDGTTITIEKPRCVETVAKTADLLAFGVRSIALDRSEESKEGARVNIKAVNTVEKPESPPGVEKSVNAVHLVGPASIGADGIIFKKNVGAIIRSNNMRMLADNRQGKFNDPSDELIGSLQQAVNTLCETVFTKERVRESMNLKPTSIDRKSKAQSETRSWDTHEAYLASLCEEWKAPTIFTKPEVLPPKKPKPADIDLAIAGDRELHWEYNGSVFAKKCFKDINDFAAYIAQKPRTVVNCGSDRQHAARTVIGVIEDIFVEHFPDNNVKHMPRHHVIHKVGAVMGTRGGKALKSNKAHGMFAFDGKAWEASNGVDFRIYENIIINHVVDMIAEVHWDVFETKYGTSRGQAERMTKKQEFVAKLKGDPAFGEMDVKVRILLDMQRRNSGDRGTSILNLIGNFLGWGCILYGLELCKFIRAPGLYRSCKSSSELMRKMPHDNVPFDVEQWDCLTDSGKLRNKITGEMETPRMLFEGDDSIIRILLGKFSVERLAALFADTWMSLGFPMDPAFASKGYKSLPFIGYNMLTINGTCTGRYTPDYEKCFLKSNMVMCPSVVSLYATGKKADTAKADEMVYVMLMGNAISYMADNPVLGVMYASMAASHAMPNTKTRVSDILCEDNSQGGQLNWVRYQLDGTISNDSLVSDVFAERYAVEYVRGLATLDDPAFYTLLSSSLGLDGFSNEDITRIRDFVTGFGTPSQLVEATPMTCWGHVLPSCLCF